MKRQILLGSLAAVAALVFTGCMSAEEPERAANPGPVEVPKAMCKAPITGDASCIEKTHCENTQVLPKPCISTFVPTIKDSKQVFRPVFTVGKDRIVATGSGLSLEEATQSALANFLTTAKCDYIVGVSRIISSKTHPTDRKVKTTNYLVTISGLPVYLSALAEEIVEKPAAEAPKAAPAAKAEAPLTKAEIIKIVTESSSKAVAVAYAKAEATAKAEAKGYQQPFGVLKLTDVKVNISAQGTGDDKAGILFPAPVK